MKDFNSAEALAYAVITAENKETRLKCHKNSVVYAFYSNFVKNILYNAAIGGLSSTTFCFYTEVNSDKFYDEEYQINAMDLLNALNNEYGFVATAFRLNPTAYIFNISWEGCMDEARECLENMSDNQSE